MSQHIRSGRPGAERAIAGALFGAVIVVIALAGAFAIADTPRQFADVVNALVSTASSEGTPPSFEPTAGTASTSFSRGVHIDPHVQVTIDVFA
ncbi:MAG TPA: hypothetical protein VMK32_10275 [Burkholderiaceae bacterium]|nr:hypothetical protein [Burkholderiaceae bacterium]